MVLSDALVPVSVRQRVPVSWAFVDRSQSQESPSIPMDEDTDTETDGSMSCRKRETHRTWSLADSASGESEDRLRTRARGRLFCAELGTSVTVDGLGTMMATAASIVSTTVTDSMSRRAAIEAAIAACCSKGVRSPKKE